VLRVKKNPKPNVIIIYLDDMGYGDLSLTGSTGYHTPNIDMLAADGIFFTHYLAPQAVSIGIISESLISYPVSSFITNLAYSNQKGSDTRVFYESKSIVMENCLFLYCLFPSNSWKWYLIKNA